MTKSASQRKGAQFERDVAAYLRDRLGIDIRRGQAGHRDDIGDLHGVPDTTIECKCWPANTVGAFAAGVDEAIIEAGNAGHHDFVAIVKRPRHAVDHAYVIVPLWHWTTLKAEQLK